MKILQEDRKLLLDVDHIEQVKEHLQGKNFTSPTKIVKLLGLEGPVTMIRRYASAIIYHLGWRKWTTSQGPATYYNPETVQ
ncbi:MAG: hypothetical protein ACXAEN_27200 [Candidatus Thorarchaeota archaeon]|jgi:hypothetical protein